MPRFFIMSACVAAMNLGAMLLSYNDKSSALVFLVLFNLWIMFSVYLADKELRRVG